METAGENLFKPGTVVGNCVIEAPVASGAFAVVYRARHKFQNTQRAIKILSPKWCADEEVLARFRQEAKLLEKLEHPHLVRIYNAGELDPALGPGLFLELEYVPTTLDTLLAQKNAPPFLEKDELLRLACELCEAVSYLHSNRILHRDIKPENLLLTESGQVKLSDLGISRVLDGTPALTIAGTEGFAAPEQLTPIHGVSVTERADVYGIGATIYYMLFRKTLMAQPLVQAPEGIAEPELLAIIKKATKSYAPSRFGSVSELASVIKAYQISSSRLSGTIPRVAAQSLAADFTELRRILDGAPKRNSGGMFAGAGLWGLRSTVLKSLRAGANLSMQLLQNLQASAVLNGVKPTGESKKNSRGATVLGVAVIVMLLLFSGLLYTMYKLHLRGKAFASGVYSNYYRQGQVYFQGGQYLLASELWEKARRVKPGGHRLDASIGLAYLRAQLPYEAAEAFGRAVTAAPQNPEYHVLLGKSYAALNRKKDAVREWQETLRLEPGNAEGKELLKNAGR